MTETPKLQRKSELSQSPREEEPPAPPSRSFPGSQGRKGPRGEKAVTSPSCPTPRTAENPNGLKLIAREECRAENTPKQETTKGTKAFEGVAWLLLVYHQPGPGAPVYSSYVHLQFLSLPIYSFISYRWSPTYDGST